MKDVAVKEARHSYFVSQSVFGADKLGVVERALSEKYWGNFCTVESLVCF
jgi:hypothetical protein